MVSFPQAGIASQQYDFNFRYQQQQSAEVSVVSTDENSKQSVSVSASSSTVVTISGKAHGQHTYASGGVAQYQAISDEPPKSQAANNILNFIGLRLEQDLADGATSEELTERLQAGYEGFLQGYGEAFEELSQAGLLSEDIEDAIAQTFDNVVAGLEALAEKYGIASPVADELDDDSLDSIEEVADEAPTQVISSISAQQTQTSSASASIAEFAQGLVDPTEGLSTLLESSRMDYERLAKNDFSFSLKTQDGDTVTIRASASSGEKAGYAAVDYSGPYADYRAGRVYAEQSQSSSFQFEVEGELDEDELAAINDLLNQVGDLSESFFSGNIEEAFAMALDIGFDESEIARFSLNLKQEVTTKVNTAYGSIAPAAPEVAKDEGEGLFRNAEHNSSIARLKVFVQMLNEVTKQTEDMGFERSAIKDITQQLAEAKGEKDKGDKLGQFMDKMLYELPEA